MNFIFFKRRSWRLSEHIKQCISSYGTPAAWRALATRGASSFIVFLSVGRSIHGRQTTEGGVPLLSAKNLIIKLNLNFRGLAAI